MTTYTLLITVPNHDAPTLASDMAADVQRLLKSRLQYTVAHVDAVRGCYLAPTAMCRAMVNTHAQVAGEDFNT